MIRAIRKAVIACFFVPVLCGSALKNRGVQRLLDAIVDFLPAFKIVSDPHAGRLCYVRIYSGEIQPATYLLNPNSGIKERIGRILRMHSNKREDVKVARAGDIVAIIGFRKTTTGDTLCSPKHPIRLDLMQFPEPVIFVAIEPKSKSDQDKLDEALVRLEEEDPTFKVKTDQETGQTIISGMGELHLDILIDRMIREFNVQANIGKPQVAYKETITEGVDSEGKFDRMTGGKNQFGHVVLHIEPAENGTPFAFQNKIADDTIPREFIPAVERGVKRSMNNGVIAGYPLTGIKVSLINGSAHDVDSTELGYEVAATMAFESAARKAKPVVLEPVMDVEVVCPETYMGNVVGDLNQRRGKIHGMVPRNNLQVVSASVPLGEMFGYATALRNLTQGRGVYTMQFSKYAPLPKDVSDKMFSNLMYT